MATVASISQSISILGGTLKPSSSSSSSSSTLKGYPSSSASLSLSLFPLRRCSLLQNPHSASPITPSSMFAAPRGGFSRRRRPNLMVVGMSMEAGIGVMGTKLGMMSYFDSDGQVVPVTVVGFREGNIVTQVKTQATDGYDAVQIGYRRVRDRKLTKPEMGHLNKAGAIPLRHLQEFRIPSAAISAAGFEPNQRLRLFKEEGEVEGEGEGEGEGGGEGIFKEGDLVDVSGTTIGKGFQGGIKRHNFRRGPMSHGSKSHRALGSIGAGTTPGRVYPGKKMPGRMGGTKRKIRKLRIVKIDNELRVFLIKGALPGKPGNLLRIAPAKIVGHNIPKN